MESSYFAFLSDPFLSCVGSMMKIDETWCQPLSEGHSARPSSTVLLPPTKTAQQLNFKGETELHIISELYPKGLFYQNFSAS